MRHPIAGAGVQTLRLPHHRPWRGGSRPVVLLRSLCASRRGQPRHGSSLRRTVVTLARMPDLAAPFAELQKQAALFAPKLGASLLILAGFWLAGCLSNRLIRR